MGQLVLPDAGPTNPEIEFSSKPIEKTTMPLLVSGVQDIDVHDTFLSKVLPYQQSTRNKRAITIWTCWQTMHKRQTFQLVTSDTSNSVHILI